VLLRRFSEHLRSQNWFAVGLDFSVVVLGIFVGLQVDNWNQTRIDKAEEAVLLAALAEDFTTNADILAEVRQNHEMVADAGEAIITYGESGAVPESERERFELFVSNHGSRFTFTPVMGAVENVLGTNKINLVSNRELIGELRRWPQVVADLLETEVAARDHFQDRIYPFLASRIDLEDHDKGFLACCFNDPATGEIRLYDREYPWSQESSDAYLLVENQEFLNLIYWHWVHSMNILNELRDVEVSLNSIRQLVDQDLGR
jgi:hypothetical protein